MFFYATLHWLAYAWFDMGFDWAEVVADIPKRPFILMGTLAWLLLLALAATSFNRAIRAGGHTGGLLVHCGRTGPLTRLALYGTPIDLVSGSALLNLLLRQRAPFMSASRER